MAAKSGLSVVFDTNILFSAAGWSGNPFRCVELARSGQIRGVTCDQIIDELTEKLAVRLDLNAEEIDEIVADYLQFHLLVEIPGMLNAVSRDPDDNAILECALAAGARIVITGDQDLLSLGGFQGIDVLSPAEFLRRWHADELSGP